MKRAKFAGAVLAVTLASPLAAQSGPPVSLTDFPLSAADVHRISGENFDVLDVHKMGWISSRAGRLYQITDLDSDGQVTKAEFIRATSQRFALMDGNKDGQITKAERDEFRQQMMRRRGGTGGQ